MATERPNYLDRITQDPKVMVGKPVVRGTRVPVERVLQHLTDNPDVVVEQKGRRAARCELRAHARAGSPAMR